MKRSFIIGSLLLISITAFAQNNWTSFYANHFRTMNSVYVIDYFDIVMVGGNLFNDSLETELTSTDAGFFFMEQGSMSAWMRDIKFSGTSNGVGIGFNGKVRKTADGGLTWTAGTTPALAHQRHFNGVCYADATTLYAVGGDQYIDTLQTIMRSTDSGNTWILIRDTSAYWLNSVYFVSSTTGIAVGDQGIILKTTNSGATWSAKTAPGSTGARHFHSVYFTDANTGFIVGGNHSHDSIQTILKTTDGGNTWNIITDNLSPCLNSVNFYDLMHGYAAGDWGTLLKTIDGGNTWTPVTLPANPLYNFNSVFFLNQDYGYVTGLWGITYRYDATTGHNPEAVTLAPTNVISNAAYMNGSVNPHHITTEIRFEYGNSTLYGTEVNANPSVSADTTFVNAYYSLTGLTPGLTYHYRVKAFNPLDTVYGTDMSFVAGDVPIVNVFPASNVTNTTAQLNGLVNANNNPAGNKFEYGTSISYGTEVIATPDSSFGNTNVNITYNLSGLTTNTTYHYRVKAISAIGTSYSSDQTFFTADVPMVTTLSANNVTPYSAQLNGMVNANNHPAASKFEYGTSTSYGSELIAIPDSATGSANVNISFQLTGLQQNTTYHYRAKAINSAGTGYGSDMVFVTPFVPPVTVITFPATGITSDSALLHGMVNPKHIPVMISFDYGLTTAYGNWLYTTPSASSDSADINVLVQLQGLTANTTYHYRLKAVSSSDTVYGNDMILFTGLPEIPNFDFEIWDSAQVDFPDGWTKITAGVTKYSPGYSGSNAMKIQNSPDGEIGAASIGFVGDAIFGGTPFNARPDSIIACFNYDIAMNDSAWVGLIFKKNGNPISMNLNKVTGSSGGNFATLKFPVQFQTSDIPDSLIMLVTCSDLNNKMSNSSSWIVIDEIRFIGTALNVPNPGFEQWHNETKLNLVSWQYKGRGIIPVDTIGTVGAARITDAVSNKYAVKLKTSLLPNGFTYGGITSGNNITDKFPVSMRHQTLTGYYKFFPQNNDTMSIQVRMFKNGNSIGNGIFQQQNAVNNYSPFIVEIYYYTGDTPDSASIIIQSFNRFPPCGASVAYVDNLNFDGFLEIGSWLSSAYTAPLSQELNLEIYPNPFTDHAKLEFSLEKDDRVIIRLFDLSGKQLAVLAEGNFERGNYRYDLSSAGLSAGLYICTICTSDKILSKKIIVH